MKLTAHQLSMLKMFEAGWAFKLEPKRRAAWNNYWMLRRHGLLSDSGMTDAGREMLAEIRNQEEMQS